MRYAHKSVYLFTYTYMLAFVSIVHKQRSIHNLRPINIWFCMNFTSP